MRSPGLPLSLVLALVSSQAAAIPKPPHDEVGNGVTCADCHTRHLEESDAAHLDTGVLTGGTPLSAADGSKSWTIDAWVGGAIVFESGPYAAASRVITANSATAISWTEDLPGSPGAGTTYRIYKSTYTDIEAKCRSCHNPTGQAATMSNVALHEVDGGTVVGCGDCHEPHNVEANAGAGAQHRLVRQKPRWAAASSPVTHPGSGASRFINGAPSYDGICEVCHTKTAHHRNDASGDHAHYSDQDCTATCHKHEAGFVVSCVGCHASTQGPRRPVIGEFPVANAHAHYGTTLAASSCTVCHDQATHGDGLVDLIDADDGHIISGTGWDAMASAPTVSGFCMSCHDADGAARLGAQALDPFASGNVPPDEKSKFQGTLQWLEQYGDFCFGTEGTLRPVNSHHDVSATDQAFSGAKIGCLNCHGSHASAQSQKLMDPFAPPMSWVGSTSDFCIACHTGGTGPLNPGLPLGVVGPLVALRGLGSCGYTAAPWYVDIIWSNTSHGPSSKRPWTGYSNAPSYSLACTSCHDAHGSYTASNTAGNPYMIRDGVDGTAMVDDGARPGPLWLGPPWDTYGLSQSVVVPVSGIDVGWGNANGLCGTCHSRWRQAYDWHDYCTGCQTCHGHGQLFGEWDWGSGGNTISCP